MKTFDWKQYVSNYNDLQHFKTKSRAWKHYTSYGIRERRTDKINLTPINLTQDHLIQEKIKVKIKVKNNLIPEKNNLIPDYLTPPINPAIVCIAKFESDYIVSFVKYHLALGFEKIYVYDNEDRPVYQKLINDPNVIVTHLPGKNYTKGVQYIALDHFIRYFMKKHTHVSHIDIDEYITLKKHDSIKDFIKEFIHGNCGGIGMNWRFFGSNGKYFKEDIPEPIRFTRCQLHGNEHIKTLFDVKSFKNFNTVHDIISKKYIKATNGTIIKGPFNKNIDFNFIQLNHYKCKIFSEFTFIRSRGRADLKHQIKEDILSQFKMYDTNEIEENTCSDFFKLNVKC